MNVITIETDETLEEVCGAAQEHTILALDTEFVREATYFPKFCLLQLAVGTHIYCIDPIRLSSLEPLKRLLDAPKPTFVLHAARQDLEVLSHSLGRLPARLLDTQLGAALSGFPDQAGYATLVAELFGTQLSKEQTRTDWSRRPLTLEQLEYAGNDVRYLEPLTDWLRHRLETLDRGLWWQEDSQRLLDPEPLTPDPKQAWLRLPGLASLDLESGGRAIVLAQWREEVAMIQDLPRSWILADDILLQWARSRLIPHSATPMRQTSRRDQQAHIQRLQQRLESPEPRLAGDRFQAERPGMPDLERKQRMKQLAEIVRCRAEVLAIAPPVLASRRDLENLIDHPSNARVLSGWRRMVIGERLLAALKKG